MQTLEELITSSPIGTMQTDSFCAGCGYNLFSQVVIRDPNTQILICRCPECGKFAPAGVATFADSGWRRAAGGLLILSRTLILLYLIVMAAIGMVAIPYSLAGEMYSFVTYRFGHYEDSVAWRHQITIIRITFSLGAVAIGLATALIAVIAFYHWRRRFYYLACLLPLLAVLVSMAFWHFGDRRGDLFYPIGFDTSIKGLPELDQSYLYLKNQADYYRQRIQQLSPGSANAPVMAQLLADLKAVEDQLAARRQLLEQRLSEFQTFASPALHMLAMASLMVVGMLIGVLFGRPVVRGMLRLLIPARALQPAAVLWFADGKPPPSTRPTQLDQPGARSVSRIV